jgi:hypothetical protein
MNLNTFQQISEDNYRRLEAYIQRLREADIKLPSRGGKVNKTAVAAACGFNRSTFVQNRVFETLINAAVQELGLEVPAKAPVPDASDKRDKAKLLVLEQQLAAVRSENYELRRKLARYEHATTTGRRVIA